MIDYALENIESHTKDLNLNYQVDGLKTDFMELEKSMDRFHGKKNINLYEQKELRDHYVNVLHKQPVFLLLI